MGQDSLSFLKLLIAAWALKPNSSVLEELPTALICWRLPAISLENFERGCLCILLSLAGTDQSESHFCFPLYFEARKYFFWRPVKSSICRENKRNEKLNQKRTSGAPRIITVLPLSQVSLVLTVEILKAETCKMAYQKSKIKFSEWNLPRSYDQKIQRTLNQFSVVAILQSRITMPSWRILKLFNSWLAQYGISTKI